jgi:hypothetical protein
MKLRDLIADYVAFRQAMGFKFTSCNGVDFRPSVVLSVAMLMHRMSLPKECASFLGLPRLVIGKTSTPR